MTEIRWTVRSANGEEAFRQSCIAAGILEDAPGYVFKPAYRNGVEMTAMQGWPGIVTKGVDGEGNPLPVPGWHCNCLAWGDVAEAMTAGLAQTDAEGNLLPLMQRLAVAKPLFCGATTALFSGATVQPCIGGTDGELCHTAFRY